MPPAALRCLALSVVLVLPVAATASTRALSMFDQAAKVPYWPAFGVIGAEMEMKRIRSR